MSLKWVWGITGRKSRNLLATLVNGRTRAVINPCFPEATASCFLQNKNVHRPLGYWSSNKLALFTPSIAVFTLRAHRLALPLVPFSRSEILPPPLFPRIKHKI